MNSRVFRLVLVSTVLTVIALAGAAPAAAQPKFTKTFLPDTIGPGSTAMLRFDIDNAGGVSPAGDLAFTDTLPAGVVIASAPGAFTNCGGGSSLSAPAGGGTISFSDGSVGAGSTCFVRVNVTSASAGTYMNVSGELTSDLGNSGTAADDLMVDNSLPGFSKSFSPDSVSLGGRSTLTFLIDNTANESNVDNLDFTDVLPTGMVIAAPANASTTCGTATIPPTLTANPGSNTIVLDANGVGAFPALETTCTVTVDVVGNGLGALQNVSGNLLAEFVEAGKAAAVLTVTAAELTLIKTFTDDPVPPGQTVTLEFEIFNRNRTETATGITFGDDLDSVVSGLAPSGPLPATPCGAGSSLSFVGGVLSLDNGSLSPEGTCTFSVTLLVPAVTSPGAFPNTTGAVMGDVGGSPTTGNTASDVLFVEPFPVLTKEFTNDPVGAGGTATLEFTITNTSTVSALGDIEFFDELTDGSSGFLPFPVSVGLPPVPDPPCGPSSSLALVTFDTDRQRLELTGGSLAVAGGPGDSCSFTVTVDIPEGFPGGTYTNTTEEITADLIDEPGDPTVTGPPASDQIVVAGAPTLTKEFTDDPVPPGGSVSLEFTLEHDPNATADATGIGFEDDLTTVFSGLTASSVDTNTCPGATVDISTNTLIDVSGGTLTPGATCTLVLTLAVDAGASSGSFTNTTSDVTATIDGVMATGNPGEDDLRVSGLLVSKEFTDDPAIPGGTVNLRFTLDNTSGASAATGIVFTDNLAADLTGLTATAVTPPTPCGGAVIGTTFIIFSGGSVASGDSCFFDVTLAVPAASDGSYSNTTSTVTFSGGTTTPAFDTLLVQSDLLAISKEFTDDPTVPGGTVTLEFILENVDPNRPASAISFSDDLGAALAGLTIDSLLFDDCGGVPAGVGTAQFSYTAGSLAANDGSPGGADTCTIRLLLDVPAGPLPGDTFTNTTSDVSGTIAGLAVNGPSASDDLRVETLVLEKSFSGVAFPGQTVDLTFTLTNLNATEDAEPLSFSDALPAGLAAVAPLPSTPCGPGSSISGTTFLTLNGGSVDAGMDCSFTVTLLVPAGAAPGDVVNTTSQVFSSGLSVAGTASDTLSIEEPPAFTKAFLPPGVGTGQTSTLVFTIDNSASSVAATGLAFTDNLPASLAVAAPPNAVDGCGGTLTALAGGTSISYTGGTVGAGADCTVSVNVATSAPGAFLNTSGDLTSSSGNSGTASSTLVVSGAPTIAKVFDPATAEPGPTTTLRFTLTNPDLVNSASDITFSDDLGAALAGLEATGLPLNNVCGFGSQVSGDSVVLLTGGSLGPGESCTFEVPILVPLVNSRVITNVTSVVQATVNGLPVTGNPADVAVADLAINLSTIPTLQEWALLFFAGLLLLVGAWKLRG